MANALRFLLIGDDRLSPVLDRAGRSAGRLDRDLNRVGDDGGQSVTQLVRSADGRLRTLDGRFARVGESADRGMGGGIERGSDRGGRGIGRLLPLIGRLGSAGGSILGALAPLGKVAGLIGGGIPVVAGLVTTLEQIAPAAAIGVTAILGVALAVGTLKIGMSGVADAVKAAFDPGTKPAELKAALAGLHPEARAFVLQLRAMKPSFDALKLDVQGNLFSGLSGKLKQLGSSVLPVVRQRLDDTAVVFNMMGLGVADAATKMARNGVLGRALDSANNSLYDLADIPGKIVTGLLQIGDAAGPSLNKVTAKVGGIVDRISAKLNTAFKSGALQNAIGQALTVLGQFGHVLHNVGTILSNVFAAVPSNAGGLVGFLGTLTSSLAKATSLPIVQQALTDLFTVMGEIGTVAGPLLTSVFKILGPVLIALAPSVLRLVDSLGAGLQPIITALGPVLLAAAGAVGQLLDAASPLLPIIGQMIASLGPILTPILQLVGTLFADLAPVLLQIGKSLLPPLATVTKTLGQAFALMAPVLATALQQLGTQGLTPIISGLATLIGQLVTQYSAQFLTMFQQLLPVVPVLIPVLLQLAQSVGQILSAAAPLVPQIMLLTQQFISQLLPAVLPLLPPLANLAILLLQLATPVITKVIIPALSLLARAAGGIGTALAGTVRIVSSVVQEIVKPFKWLYDVLLGHSIIPDIINQTVTWFAGLPGRVLTAITGLPGAIAGKARDAGNQLVKATRKGLDDALAWVKGLPGRAKDSLGDLSNVLYKSGRSLIGGFIDGILSMAKSAGSAASSVLGKVKGFFPNSPAKEGPFSGRGWTLYSGQAVMDDWAAGMSSRQSGVVGAVSGLAAAAAGALPRQMAAGLGINPGASAPAPARQSTGPITITVPGVGQLVLAKEIQRALLELKRVSGINISLEIA